MAVPNHLTQSETMILLREEIARFVDATHERSEYDATPRRRARRRYHRSWPLLVSHSHGVESTDLSVALHNASEFGVAFLSSERFRAGEMIFIKLFWYDAACPRVPARVRHVTLGQHGYLIGCEFVFDDSDTHGHHAGLPKWWYDEPHLRRA